MDKRYLFTEIVDKVFQYTGNEMDSKYSGLMVLAKVIEENRLEIHKSIHHLRAEMNYLSDCLNGNLGNKVDLHSCYESWNSNVAVESAVMDSAINLANRAMDYLFENMKQMLAPVWKVYWSEGCNSFVSIVMWLERADKDEGKLVKEFLSR